MKLLEFVDKFEEPRDVNPFRLLGGGFLIYLAVKLIYALVNHESTAVFLSIGFAIIFFLLGLGVLLYELRMYRKFTGKIKPTKTTISEKESNLPEDKE